MLRHNVPLAWEKRAFPGTESASVTDTIYIKLVKMGITNAPYVRLKIMTSFGPEVLAAKLLDTQGPGIPVLNVNGTTNYDYTLTMSDPSGTASKDPDRIMIVVSKTATFSRPFFISATATPTISGTKVSWDTENEDGVELYEVQGLRGNKANGVTIARMFRGQHSYEGDVAGYDRLRIKAVHQDGRVEFSEDIVIAKKSLSTQPTFSVYPNPATSGRVYLQFGDIDPGMCDVVIQSLVNGRMFVRTIFTTKGAIELPLHDLPKGLYSVKITTHNGKVQFLPQKILL
jgi:hypothetical protein